MDNIKIKRIVAYTIDIFIISGIVLLLSQINILNPNKEILLEKTQELNEISESLVNNTTDIINIKEYATLAHDIAYYSITASIVEALVIILYFTFFPYFFEGQTIGKKLLKLKIVNKDDEKKPSFSSLLLRSLLVPVSASLLMYNSIAYILIILSTLVLKGTTYLTVYMGIYIIATIYCYIDIIKMLSNKEEESLHDKITNTKVIKC